jgi:amino acid adenylation domain-containing protein
MTLLAAVHILLQRYCGTNDVATGSPIAGRSRTELEGLIGFFINTLVMRTDLSGNPTFMELFGRVREMALGAYTHQDLPFEKLVETLLPERDLSKNPLFQVMFVLQNAPTTELQLEGLVSSRVKTILESAKFDLTIELTEQQAGLRGRINYNTDLFDKTTIVRMAGHLQTLLKDITGNPECPLSKLPLLTDTERHQLQFDWNQTQTAYPREQTITTLFESQVEHTPDAVALEFGKEQLTYSELNTRANRLAHYLQARGVGPEVMVAVCVERSIEMVVGLLGILKAGGAYVPLAPDYPQKRLEFMIEDTGAPLLLTQSSLRASLPAFSGEVVLLDTDWPAIERESGDNPVSATTPASLMYIIYTSGSTGRPKGVCVEHHSAVRLVKNTNYVELGFDEVFLQFAPISFDASTFELWGSLLNGAKLVIFPAEWSSLKELGQLIEDKGITTLWLTSVLFSQMVEQQLHSLAGVRQLLAGGETLSVPHVRKMLTQPGNHRLINGYGPTENTTFTCCHVMTADSRVEESVPIGRPISNTSVYILDAQMNPVPIGVFGELYTGGEGVARGYLNQPSSDRFVDDPFSDVPGARLYNTGDMVRYRADGTIEFMGRRDQQVKIRGFRIELGEIEAALQDLPEVSQVVVMVREDDLSDKQMVAYIVGEYLTPDDLRIRLKKRLPEYMIPAAFVALPELPLTANGKIDRSALPGPKNEAVQSNKYPGPRNKLELHLVKIWESLLGTEPVGVTDDFFMLGGHSLLAARMFDEIQMLFGKKLPLDTLWFGGATIEHLAQVLDADESTVTWPTLIQIKEGGDRPPLFCVHTQGGNLFHYYDMANELAVDQPVYGLQARGVYGREDFHHRIEDIAAHCIDTMRAKLPDGPYLITGFSSGGLVAFEMAQQLLKAGVPPAMLVLVDTFPPHIRRHGHYWNKIKEFIRLNKLRYLQERIYHAIMQPLHMDRFRKFSHSGEAHRWAQWSYRTKPYPGPVTLFMAEASNSQTRGSSLGWDQLTPSLKIYTIPGTHGMMVKPPHVTRLATLMQSLIDSSEITGNKHL